MKKLLLFLLFMPMLLKAVQYPNSVCVKSFSHSSPGLIHINDFVTLDLSYNIGDPSGARIFVIPYKGGQQIMSAAYSPSGIVTGIGSTTRKFTITSGEAQVDSVIIYATNPDQSIRLLEYYVPVNYKFTSTGIYDLTFMPGSNASLLHGNRVNITYNFNSTYVGGTRIFFLPFSDGVATTAFAVSGSALHTGTGPGTSFVTVTSGNNVTVDSINIRITSADQSVLIYEYFVPVKYYFSNTSVNITAMESSSPSLLPNGTDQIVKFDYKTTETSGVRIFVRPYSKNSLSPSYSASGSIIHTGNGNSSSRFTISEGNLLVDHLRIQVWNVDQTIKLLEYLHPVQNAFGTSLVYDINFCPASPASFKYNDRINISFKYTSTESGGIRVYFKPRANGQNLLSQANSGSSLYSDPSGTGSFHFTMQDGPVHIDEVLVSITKSNVQQELYSFSIPVDYNFGPSVITANTVFEDQHFAKRVSSYPLPFQDQNFLNVKIEEDQKLRITVVNAIGVEVARVFNGQASKGDNQYIFNGKELEPGLYNYIISGENFEAQEKIVLIK